MSEDGSKVEGVKSATFGECLRTEGGGGISVMVVGALLTGGGARRPVECHRCDCDDAPKPKP